MIFGKDKSIILAIYWTCKLWFGVRFTN